MDPDMHFSDLFAEFRIGMLVTHARERLHARPMAIAGLSSDGTVYLATSLTSPKTQEIAASSPVLITFQGPTQFVTLEGTARVNRDREVIAKLWSDSWLEWFPRGKDDPDICLIEIEPQGGERWDSRGGGSARYSVDGLRAVFEANRHVDVVN